MCTTVCGRIPVPVVAVGQPPLLHTEVVVADLWTELLLADIIETAGTGRVQQIHGFLLAVFSYIEIDLTRTSNLAAGLHPEKPVLIGVTPVRVTGRLRLPALTRLWMQAAAAKSAGWI